MTNDDTLCFICDYCAFPMEERRSMHQWCEPCMEWWMDHMGGDQETPSELHTTATLVKWPLESAEYKFRNSLHFSGKKSLVDDITTEQNDDQLTIRVPRDRERRIAVTVNDS